jgi:hypothetical protein
MKQDPPFALSLDQYNSLHGRYPVLERFHPEDFPITRQDYLDLHFGPDAPPDPVPAEIEMSMPPQLRLPQFRDI